jgi:hypothetical protein
MKTKEEFLEEWKDDPKVSDPSYPEIFRWQRAILMEGYNTCSLWRGGSKERTLYQWTLPFSERE